MIENLSKTEIYFEDEAKESLQKLFSELSPSETHFLLVDSNTLEHCYPLLIFMGLDGVSNIEVIEVNPGEASKSLQTVEIIIETMLELGGSRHSHLLNLGGGMVSDLGGFVASIFKRGISFHNIPTSLLAMIDASFGGKTAVNSVGSKNQIGSFYKPKSVFVIGDFLETLPKKEIRCGNGEMLKHALIKGGDFWADFKQNFNADSYPEMNQIKASVQVKNDIVEMDFFELGERKKLNLGHTLGHAIEALHMKSKNPISHGEAVAFGLVLELFVAIEKAVIAKAKALEVIDFITKHFEIQKLQNSEINQILNLVKSDKKNSNNQLRFSLLSDMGQVQIDVAVSPDELQKALLAFNRYG